jgi:hypothetical protein
MVDGGWISRCWSQRLRAARWEGEKIGLGARLSLSLQIWQQGLFCGLIDGAETMPFHMQTLEKQGRQARRELERCEIFPNGSGCGIVRPQGCQLPSSSPAPSTPRACPARPQQRPQIGWHAMATLTLRLTLVQPLCRRLGDTSFVEACRAECWQLLALSEASLGSQAHGRGSPSS